MLDLLVVFLIPYVLFFMLCDVRAILETQTYSLREWLGLLLYHVFKVPLLIFRYVWRRRRHRYFRIGRACGKTFRKAMQIMDACQKYNPTRVSSSHCKSRIVFFRHSRIVVRLEQYDHLGDIVEIDPVETRCSDI